MLQSLRAECAVTIAIRRAKARTEVRAFFGAMSKYSQEKCIEVLARLQLNEGGVSRTARECGLSRSTVYRFIKAAEAERAVGDQPVADGEALLPVPESEPGTELIVAPAPLSAQAYTDPNATMPLWYAVELRTHQLLDAMLADIAKSADSWTTDDALRLVKMAQIAHGIRTGKGGLGGGNYIDNRTPTVVVEFTEAPKRREG